jgi:hypothetical protein
MKGGRIMKNARRLMTAEEEKAVALLIYEYIQLKDRNATDQEMMEWRNKVREKFPETKDQIFGSVAQHLSNRGSPG